MNYSLLIIRIIIPRVCWLRIVVVVLELNGVTKWIKSCLLPCFGTFKMPILMFIRILVFRPEGQI